MDSRRRRIPRTDSLLVEPRLAAAADRLGRATVKAAVVAAQGQARQGEITPEAVADAAVAALPAHAATLRPVLNATGVIVHTNLGRAPLSAAAVDALAAAAGTTDVELDLATGRRGRRGEGAAQALAAAVPTAEAVHVVNNNAAALVLAATTLAQGRDVVLSRGELVEIGDGFRIPDLLASTGARLREVGTTNRTALADYAAALDDTPSDTPSDTPNGAPGSIFDGAPAGSVGAVLKVHPSNFVISGFTAAVAVAELAPLCARHAVPLVVDVGSGLLAPDPLLPAEPDVATALAHGADLVCASGDKLLGGPQCGLLFGRAALVTRLRRHPLARALRVDKLTLAALEATLRGPEPPVRRMLTADVAVLRARAGRLVDELCAAGCTAEVAECESAVGGGGAPGVTLPSVAVSLPTWYAEPLRLGEPPVLARVERDRTLLDLRTVEPASDQLLADAVRRAGDAHPGRR
ncbi:MAG TPA: L-seryl-tRNA(Sec) selenium transferase [Mycobacteriales bacterium]|nr:L-seryl-tRNA(Sec) selenium transferase [Mycobacteriales bacterium]